MSWALNFISEKNFETHVKETILKYGKQLQSYTLQELNKNIVDPVKLIFDKSVYRLTWDEIIKSEIFRQRDKSNNNSIGYFHQNFFKYLNGCEVPEKGWDVIYKTEKGIEISEGEKVHTIYVEMKNKHNTMNSASSAKTYIKMQNQLLLDDDCACFIIDAIAKNSQNIKWSTTVDGKQVGHRRIRRVSMDKFYEIITGEKNAFFEICKVLPKTVQHIIETSDEILREEDTAYTELAALSKLIGTDDKNLSFALAIYMLGFNTYNGFDSLKPSRIKDSDNLSEYAEKLLMK